jgi:NADPH:quinone reductase
MRAIVLEKFGGLDSLVYKDIPEPEPKAGHVVIQIKAFGLNHAELHMRRGEWAEAANVSGIECVGLVKSSPGGEFPVGAKVAALMGGLGRTINGSYAEYTRAPASNVALIESDLPWAELAAIPETYATAWTCLFRNLEIKRGQLLVIRGATSSFGQAALKMAVNAGARVIATTRNRERFAMLEKLGAERCEIERRDLSKRIARGERSMRCSIWWATPSCSTRLPCFAAAAVPVSPAGSAASILFPTSTRCCRCRAASI